MDEYNLNNVDLNAEGTTETVNTDVAPSQNIAPTTSEMFKYTADGREVEEDRETVLKRASQGYHYAQNMQQLKTDRATFEQTIGEKEAKLRESEGRWSKYDDYARENPDWATHVNSAWENRASFNGQEGTQGNLSPEMQKEMSELRQFKDEFRGFLDTQKREREDMELNTQVEGTQKEYPDIDFKYSNPESGKSLEFQVYEHMQAKGLNDFKAGFRDFYHEQLLARAVTKAKEDTAKTLQDRNQQGYIGQSDTSFGLNKPTSLRNKSYDALIDEGISELNIT